MGNCNFGNKEIGDDNSKVIFLFSDTISRINFKFFHIIGKGGFG